MEGMYMERPCMICIRIMYTYLHTYRPTALWMEGMYPVSYIHSIHTTSLIPWMVHTNGWYLWKGGWIHEMEHPEIWWLRYLVAQQMGCTDSSRLHTRGIHHGWPTCVYCVYTMLHTYGESPLGIYLHPLHTLSVYTAWIGGVYALDGATSWIGSGSSHHGYSSWGDPEMYH